MPTPAGVDAGLRSEDKVSARGTPYSVLLFTPEAQRMVVEHFIKAEASPRRGKLSPKVTDEG